jgi:parallel beta-helix repeat protein
MGNDNINISNNNISNCTGTENASAGIRLQNTATTTTEVSGNIVSNINIGIAIEPDANNFDITGNTFSNIKVLGGYRWYNIYGSYEDLEAVLENNSFPDGSEVQPNPNNPEEQNIIIVPGS